MPRVYHTMSSLENEPCYDCRYKFKFGGCQATSAVEAASRLPEPEARMADVVTNFKKQCPKVETIVFQQKCQRKNRQETRN